jgi:two-component system NtrC family sensor kinase
MSFPRGLLPQFSLPEPAEADGSVPKGAYRALRRSVVLATATVALVPLIITTFMNYMQYREALQAEAVQPMARLTLNTKRSLELFLSERRSVLTFLVHERPFSDLCNEQTLMRMISNLNRSLEVGAFVDLGVIDDRGDQLCYSGPYELAGRNYIDQDWFHEVARLGTYTSDVFLGFRNSPHFAIATRHDRDEGGFYILRATIDADMLSEQILTAGLNPTDDVFLINRQGILQSPSRRYGEILQPFPMPVPHFSPSVEDVEVVDPQGEKVFISSAYIASSPFILVHVKPAREAMGRWFSLRSELIGFLIVSTALIIGVILWGSGLLVRRMKEADERRTALYHHVEYSNKLASIGRLAAGVAHEINNPLAIINEKAGLVLDLVRVDPDVKHQERLVAAVDSILKSVQRCKKVTHRLLGFARHMDVTTETIDLETLLKEVLGFLEKEAEYREVTVHFDLDPEVPTITSDRGQLQQVFLNILNNAVAAVAHGGNIGIEIVRVGLERVAVTVADDGVGIPKNQLERIFEPFFTTKDGSGTGLGLSITYGIVKKLGGEIRVESTLGEGTRFTVELPISSKG